MIMQRDTFISTNVAYHTIAILHSVDTDRPLICIKGGSITFIFFRSAQRGRHVPPVPPPPPPPPPPPLGCAPAESMPTTGTGTSESVCGSLLAHLHVFAHWLSHVSRDEQGARIIPPRRVSASRHSVPSSSSRTHCKRSRPNLE